MEKIAWDGPKWGRKDFFLLIQTLPTFWAERILILRFFIFFIFLTPNFWISRFPDISNLAWVGPGLSLGWARGSAVLGRGGGRRAPQHSTATGPPKAQARPDPGQI